MFSVNRSQENKDDLYSNLVFFLLGEDFDHSQHICGFRFISPKNSQSFFRVEIWVDFPDEKLDMLKHYQHLLTELFKTLNFDSKSVKFLNNRSDKKEGDKEAGKGEKENGKMQKEEGKGEAKDESLREAK